MLSILFIGDVVGKPGRVFMGKRLPALIGRYQPDMVIANGENAAGGKGITESVAEEFFRLGVDIITLGNHAWDNREAQSFIGSQPRLVRPANYPEGAPGKGWAIHEVRPGMRPIAVVNLMGRTFMNALDCPFQAFDRVLPEICQSTPGDKPPIVFVDFHAEATSEKEAMGFYLAQRAVAVVGTHTHVQTADERLLPGGAAYITDAGMTGTRDSVLGVDPEIMIRHFLSRMPVRHELAEGPAILSGVLVRADESTGKATEIIRIAELER
ncbi:MAG: TIGR00282 family metallophosphoesterase [Clostridiales bacterium]|nr:TIGR00282 family metallophosphoesterase [Clostridiales bacterium]